MTYNAAESRELFLQLKEKYKNKFNVSYSVLSLDAIVGNGDIRIPVLQDDQDNGNTPRNVTERRLPRNHQFIATSIFLGLKKVVSGGHAQARLWTYPNPAEFADNAGTFIGAHLNAIYAGIISLSQDGIAAEPGIETLRFLHAPAATQNGEATVTDEATPVTTTVQTRFDPFHPGMGEVPLSSYLILNGTSTHEVMLRIPGGTGLKMAHTAANTQNFVNLRLRGYLIENIFAGSNNPGGN
jgi:hypothetical protein